MSTHSCQVVPVELLPHPDAEKLSLVKVWGYTVVVRTEDWKGVDRGVYIPPDYVVPQEGQFLFLGDKTRIKVRRFRGVYSQGLLLPAPEGSMLGQDFMEAWGITRYEPPIDLRTDGDAIAGPPGLFIPKYDLENFARYSHCLPEGTEVSITEKIHGANSRFVCFDGTFYVGSRSQWKGEGSNVWWRAAEQNSWIREWCEANPDSVLFGEVFGQVQDLKYGAEPKQVFFRAFDVLYGGQWVDHKNISTWFYGGQLVPEVYRGPFNAAMAMNLAEQNSQICPGQLSEGVVITPLTELTHPEIGRVKLKIVSNRYMEG